MTKYRDGTLIPNITDNAQWSNLSIGAMNSSGLSGIPGGYRRMGFFKYKGSHATFWSSTEHDNSNVWLRLLHYTNSDVYRNYNTK